MNFLKKLPPVLRSIIAEISEFCHNEYLEALEQEYGLPFLQPRKETHPQRAKQASFNTGEKPSWTQKDISL
jgi:hypothetical protein